MVKLYSICLEYDTLRGEAKQLGLASRCHRIDRCSIVDSDRPRTRINLMRETRNETYGTAGMGRDMRSISLSLETTKLVFISVIP